MTSTWRAWFLIALTALTAPTACADVADDALDAELADLGAEALTALGPVITEVVTDDGFHQVRQGEAATLILRGHRLEGTERVQLGKLPLTILAQGEHEVRVRVVVAHGATPGARPLLLVTHEGRAGALLVVTPVVAGPAAAPGGHGTYESPMPLCGVAPVLTERDTLELLAGEYRCDQPIDLVGGVTVRGAGIDHTIVRASPVRFGETFRVERGAPSATTTVQGLTATGGALLVIGGDVGGLDLHDVAFADATNVVRDLWTPVMRRYRVRNARFERASLSVDRAIVDLADSEVRDSDVGFAISDGRATLARVLFERCTTGVEVGGRWSHGPSTVFPEVTLRDIHMVDVETGVGAYDGRTTLERVEIVDDPVSGPVCQNGVSMLQSNGTVSLGAGTVIRCTRHGVVGEPRSDDGIRLVADGVIIEGGQEAIRMSGYAGSSVRLRRSRVRGGAAAIAMADGSDPWDLGRRDDPGHNELSVAIATGAAVLDYRDFANTPTRMVGTTINGRSYEGQLIRGPHRGLPDFDLLGPTILDFADGVIVPVDAGVPDAAVPDAAVPDAGVPDAGVPDAGVPDAGVPDAGIPDAGVPDASDPELPLIAAVATDDGFTQLRQGAAATLVIRGARLTGTSAVSLGSLSTTILSVRDDEVRVDVAIPHGHARGPLRLTLTTDHGSAARDAAIIVTFTIVAPDGAADGRGTYQSPRHLCAIGSDLVTFGDTLELLAGEHRCDATLVLDSGVDIRGAGSGATVVRGQQRGFGGFWIYNLLRPEMRTRISGLTILDPAGMAVLSENQAGGLVVDDLEVRGGGPLPAVLVADVQDFGAREVQIDRFRYVGAGAGLWIDAATDGRVTRSRIAGCSTGVVLGRGSLEVSDTRIEGCTVGVETTLAPTPWDRPSLAVVDSTLVGNRTGARVRHGGISLVRTHVVDDDARPGACQTGVEVSQGYTGISDSVVSCRRFGVVAHSGGSPRPWEDALISAAVVGSTIEGGEIGVDYDGVDRDSELYVQNARIRGGTVAGLRIGGESRYFLGSATSSGGNDLSVVSPLGFAFVDRRDGESVNGEELAIGTTLNGRAYPGVVLVGPARLAPDYDIARGEWRF